MIINGREIADQILSEIKKEVLVLPFKPVFCDVLVGDDPVSLSYVRIKGKTASRVGIGFKTIKFNYDIFQAQLEDEVKKLNLLPDLCGLIIQLPLPKGFSQQPILDAIDPHFDVDCMGSKNLESFYQGKPRFVPPTAAAIMAILDNLKVDLIAKKVLVIGQGDLVGKPVSFLLRQKSFTVQIADRKTADIFNQVKKADIIISATGQANLIKGEMVKQDSIIIDAGTSEINGGIVGDVEFESVSKVAGLISPVPGGVGPVTVAKLLKNVLLAAQSR